MNILKHSIAMRNASRFALFVLIHLGSLTILHSEVRLPHLISDGAVLQRDIELKIWGWATPNETVQINFKDISKSTLTDQNGNWEITIPPQRAGGPYTMTIKGDNEIKLENLLIGEVWICSGQSNMELTMYRLRDEYPEVIANSENPQIRQYLVPDRYDFNTEWEDHKEGSWKMANPDNLMEFSGVAYFFALELYERYKVPIGLINAALGGSPVESWMSEEALKEFPRSYDELNQYKDTVLIKSTESADQLRQRTWYNDLNAKDLGYQSGHEWYLSGIDDDDWAQMNVPSFWMDHDIGDVNGAVWFRKSIQIPEHMTGQNAKLWLGRIVDQDHVYVNGKFVGTTGYQYPPRKYEIPSEVLRTGENSITIRVINERGHGGFILDKPYFLSVGSDTIYLSGSWKYKLGTTMPPLDSPTFIRWKAGGLYKAMIAPILNYKIRGAIWYQGESNTKHPKSYNKTFPAMIRDWRNKWQIGNFPFLYVQLANFMEESNEPTESNWAELRQAQLNTLTVPNTGMAVITDLGEWNDIHPLNKRDVGKRLSQLAFQKAYKESLVTISPAPQKAKFKRKKCIVTFDKVEYKLVSKGDAELHYFELSADGIHFYSAKAKIKGNRLIVWHDDIVKPKAIRYGWADNPATANLYTMAGLPITPFEFRK